MEAAGDDHRKVVVIGGGVAGSIVTKYIQFDAHVALVDSKEYLEIPWAMSRSKVEPLFAERSVIKHTDYLSNAKIFTSPAIGISEKEVLTQEGRTVAYDYLVIATGHTYDFPVSRNERLQQFQQDNKQIISSNTVLIIGGGRTGVELAGEIAVDFSDKKVILVHNGSRLLPALGPKASEKALKWLTSKGVDVLLEYSIDLDSISDGDKEFRTSGGKTITADCYFVCVRKPVGSSWLQETFLKDKLDKFGRLEVDQYLRVNGHKNIFAVGDILNINEIKHGFRGYKHAAIVSKNLKLLMNGGDENKLAVYKPASTFASVSLGRKQAVAQLPFTTVIGHFPGLFKSKDLFVGRARKKLGLSPQII